ncbi:ABC transporter permease [Candidatus Shapirobacteria bacterium]|nr:ABC transporter permease [Candidatus Shapirobacteria bacterium]
MTFKKLLKIAWKSVRANKSRSLLTTLGVIIGVASVIILVAVGSGLKDFITSEMQDMGSNLVMVMPGDIDLKKVGTGGGGGGVMSSGLAAMQSSKIKYEYLNDIQQVVPQVKDIVGLVMGSATTSYQNKLLSSQIFGTTENYSEMRKYNFTLGGFFNQADVSSGRKVAVIGHKVAEDLFSNSPVVIGEKIKVGDYRYTVVGVIEEKGGQGTMTPDDKIYIPITVAQRQFGQDNIGLILMEANSPEDVPLVLNSTEDILKRKLKDDEFTVLDQKEILSTVSGILNTLTVALGGIAAISLIVGGIGIMNIMLVSVTERTQEIGLRKALGAKPEVILTQFLIEAVVLSIGGGILGVLLGGGGALFLGRFMPTTITLWSVILAFAVSAAIGIIFGVAPARKASQLSPIEALRHE